MSDKPTEPIIISASRATDIAGFFGDWFVDKWQKGECKWKNPFKGTNSERDTISLKKARAVVFWSKYPQNFFKHLDFVKENIPIFYFQYTLNDYDKNIEQNLPNLNKRIECFKNLSEQIGKDRIIWRFDPLILSDEISLQNLLEKIEFIGDELKNHTEKFVFSFLDIYGKTGRNMHKAGIKYIEWNAESMNEFAQKLSELKSKKGWNFTISTCAEKIDLAKHNITHNKCIDDDLILKLLKQKIEKQGDFVKDCDKELLDYLGWEYDTNPNNQKEQSFPEFQNQDEKFKKISKKNTKDKGQRKECGCIASKDIGAYNTCPFGCVYCYANDNLETPKANFKNHNPQNASLEAN
ncbi:DUF1848 domain-containing protein [Helicobacter sp. 23-1044]